jgi:hypothetical protein
MSACSILAGREVLARRAAMRHRRQKMRHHTPLREAACLSRKMTFETLNSARGMLTTGCPVPGLSGLVGLMKQPERDPRNGEGLCPQGCNPPSATARSHAAPVRNPARTRAIRTPVVPRHEGRKSGTACKDFFRFHLCSARTVRNLLKIGGDCTDCGTPIALS